MSRESKEFSLRRARILTVVVMTVVAAAIALANLSSKPVTIDFFEKRMTVAPAPGPGAVPERAYGWPLTWYWRSLKSVPGKPPVFVPYTIQWPASRHSASRLTANLAIWLAMLAASSVACEWLLRRYRPRLHWRPRVSTLIVLMIVSALTVLSNLSFNVSPERGLLFEVSYGWPLIWYWKIVIATPFSVHHAWDYSAAGLSGNLLLWILMLLMTGLTWQWLLRRYRPRLRFSLRTMLAGVGLVAALCAWCVAARNRSQEQDALIAWAGDDDVYLERWGPKWLDVVGADRFRRRVVGALVWNVRDAANEAEQNEALFKRLARLPSLRFLDIHLDGFTPGMAAALSDMRQLRMLNVDCRVYRESMRNPDGTFTWDKGHRDDVQCVTQCLAAVGKLTQLERLRVEMWEENSDDLACLADLTNLKSLTLDIGNEGGPRALARLPELPRLEVLDLHDTEVGDQDLHLLAGFPRLKSLDLSGTSISDAGLAELAPLESLEELAIDVDMATTAGFEALIALKRLRAVHIAGSGYDETDRPAPLAHGDGHELTALSSELDGLRRALQALRQSNPGIVFDAGYDDFQEKGNLEPPWSDHDRSFHSFVRRWLKEP